MWFRLENLDYIFSTQSIENVYGKKNEQENTKISFNSGIDVVFTR